MRTHDRDVLAPRVRAPLGPVPREPPAPDRTRSASVGRIRFTRHPPARRDVVPPGGDTASRRLMTDLHLATPARIFGRGAEERCTMSEAAIYEFGSRVYCSDADCGELLQVVVEPDVPRLVQLVVCSAADGAARLVD